MKIDFSWSEPEARFHGVEHLTLNNMIQDRTMLREHAYYHYAAMRGVPAARHGFARVRVNGELYGLYGIVETMDEHFVHRAFQLDDEGPLYEGSGCDLTYARDWYELEEAGLAGDVDDLVATVESTDAGAFFSMLNAEFDVDSLFTYWAMDLASGNDDGYARNHHNYLLYYGPTAHRWWMIPWGTDRSFEDHVSVHGVSTDLMGVLVTRCLDDAACAGQLDARILDVAEGWADSGLEAWVEDAIPVILDDCEADPKAELPCDPWSLPSYMDRRVGEVEGELAP
jgi:spore coat protein CotH